MAFDWNKGKIIGEEKLTSPNDFGWTPPSQITTPTKPISPIAKKTLPIVGTMLNKAISKGQTGKNILDFGGKVLGVNEFMSGAGKRISQLVNPNIEKNLRIKMEKGEITPQQYVQELTGASGISPEDYKNLQKQMAGSAAQGLINTAGLLYSPASSAARILYATGLGATEKAAKNIKENQPITSGVATSGLLSGAVSGVGEGVSALTNKFLAQKPLSMYEKAFGVSKDEVAKEVKALAQDVDIPQNTAKWALNKGYSGTAKDIAVQSLKDIQLYNNSIDNFVKQAPLPIPVDNKQTKLILEKIKDGWSSAAFLNKMDEADDLLSELGNKNEISADLANRIKKFIDNSRSTASFHINPNMSEKQAAMKFTADSLRGSLKDTYGFMKKTLNDESKAYEIFNGMLHKATKKPEGISAALRSLGPLDLALDILGSKGAASSMKTINNLFNQVGFRTTTAQFLKKLAEGRATPEGKKTMETLGKLYRTSPQLIRNKMSIPFLPNEYSNE